MFVSQKSAEWQADSQLAVHTRYAFTTIVPRKRLLLMPPGDGLPQTRPFAISAIMIFHSKKVWSANMIYLHMTLVYAYSSRRCSRYDTTHRDMRFSSHAAVRKDFPSILHVLITCSLENLDPHLFLPALAGRILRWMMRPTWFRPYPPVHSGTASTLLSAT